MPLAEVVLACLVVGITDDDTLKARCDQPDGTVRTIVVRLAEIDAPERAQPFGQRSRQHLAGLCRRERAEVRPVEGGGGLDRYGRTVAHVACRGIDANSEQVRVGLAWAFDRYVEDPRMFVLQREAEAARVGLWARADPIPPWEWRAAKREARSAN